MKIKVCQTLNRDGSVRANGKNILRRYQNGEEVQVDKYDPNDAVQRRKICHAFGIDDTQLRAAEQCVGEEYDLVPRREDTVFYGRSMSDSERTEYESFEEACRGHELVEWGGDDFCCLDLDVAAPLGDVRLKFLAATVRPAPVAWDESKNGGMHLYYETRDGFTGRELAAVAALWVVQHDPTIRPELKRVTRSPKKLNVRQPTSDMVAVSQWMSRSIENRDVEEWLVDRGWRKGERKPHSECLIAPSDTSGNDPVLIGDYGVTCFHCEAAGLTYGSRSPGFTPYTALMADRGAPSEIAGMVRAMTHWEHARVVLKERLGVRGELAKLGYTALLKLIHGHDDMRLRNLHAGEGLLRVGTEWQFLDGTPLALNNGRGILARFPAAQCRGSAAPILDRVDLFCQRIDLTRHGYVGLVPVRGCRIYGHHLDYPDSRVTVVRHSPSLQNERYGPLRPRYIGDKSRIDPWPVFEKYFPGINPVYLQVLVAARGFAEAGTGLPPMLAVDGPTGSAKSATVQLAAAVCGDSMTEIVWTRDEQRFRQAVFSGARRGSFVACNEILKDALRAKVGPKEAMEPILNLTPQSTTHQLYVGQSELGSLPVFVFTDTQFSLAVAEVEQIARRVHWVVQPKAVDWVSSLTQHAEGRKISELRHFGPDAVAAANSLLSNIIDRWFTLPTTFDEVCDDLNVPKLNAKPEFADRRDIRDQFFKAVCEAPDAPEVNCRRWGGRGWKVIRQADVGLGSTLASLWAELADDTSFTTSQKLSEYDWGRKLGVSGVRVDLRANGNSIVGIRFYLAGQNRNDYKVNEEIVE